MSQGPSMSGLENVSTTAPCVVQDEHAAGRAGTGQRAALLRRQAAHHHPATGQDAQRSRESDAARAGGTGRQARRGHVGEELALALGRHLHNGGAGPLHIGLAVEVADQRVASHQLAACLRRPPPRRRG